MATENVSYGWQGKIARVNLTTGEITTQSTDPYKYFLGGMGMANKIMYDEVPAGTDPFSPESKVVMAVGRSPLRAFRWPAVLPSRICPPTPPIIWLSILTAAA